VLNCLVLGEDPGSGCVVRVKRSANVYDLKKAIKSERSATFLHVDAAVLVLWTVVLPLDICIGNPSSLGDMRLFDCLPELQLPPGKVLSSVFPH